jgi:carbon-monoxide dehydrogenase large subunit
VVAVLTAEDLGLEPLRSHHMLPPVFDRPPLAHALVRFVGEPIAVVVARTREAAVDAADLVAVDFAPLDAIVDLPHAARHGAPPLFLVNGDNVVFERTVGEATAVDELLAAVAADEKAFGSPTGAAA